MPSHSGSGSSRCWLGGAWYGPVGIWFRNILSGCWGWISEHCPWSNNMWQECSNIQSCPTMMSTPFRNCGKKDTVMFHGTGGVLPSRVSWKWSFKSALPKIWLFCPFVVSTGLLFLCNNGGSVHFITGLLVHSITSLSVQHHLEPLLWQLWMVYCRSGSTY
jgi:hypothetical protein